MSEKKTVLIIEDEQTTRTILEVKFKEHGFTVLVSSDGEEGLELALKERPDLILLDVGLPKMDGTKVLHSLRKDGWGKTARVMILSKIDTDAGKLQSILEDHPCFYLLKKDWKIEEVVHKAEELLQCNPK